MDIFKSLYIYIYMQGTASAVVGGGRGGRPHRAQDPTVGRRAAPDLWLGRGPLVEDIWAQL